jgi:hypothetical protein
MLSGPGAGPDCRDGFLRPAGRGTQVHRVEKRQDCGQVLLHTPHGQGLLPHPAPGPQQGRYKPIMPAMSTDKYNF